MSWIQAHQELGSHYKTRRLARTLEISVPQAVGHVMLLWWWCVDYAPDGDLEGFDAVEIAEAAQYEGDPEAFVEAMQECGRNGRGFLNGLQVNDWAEYTDGYKKLQAAGVLGNHRRWHVSRETSDPNCEHCLSPRLALDSPPDSPPMSPPISGGIPVQRQPTPENTVSGPIAPDVAPESEERRGEEIKPPPTPPKGDGGEESSTQIPLPDEVEQWVEMWGSKEYADRMLTPSLKSKWTGQVERFISEFGAPTRGILRRAREAGISHPAGWEYHIPAERKPPETNEPSILTVCVAHVWAQVEDDERICSRCRQAETRDESGEWI